MVKLNIWVPVNLEGPICSGELEGLIGIEELSSYDENTVFKNKKKNNKKRKLAVTEVEVSTPKKLKTKIKKSPTILKENEQLKIEPGAFVRHPKFLIDNKSKTNDDVVKKKQNKVKQVVPRTEKKPKVEIGETAKDDSKQKYSIEDLIAWSIVSLPDPLLQGLADLGFTKPTAIQELTLPPAILGRRDILGAAETGSGKTLAFGLPILAGILKLKEEAIQKLEEDGIETEASEDESAEENNSSDQDANSDLETEEAGVEDEESDIENSDVEDDSDLEDESVQEMNDSDVSDFDEKDEDVEDLDAEGIGCVRSIDNIQMDDVFPKSNPVKPLYALILTPTRELAMQIKNHLIAAAKYTDIKVAVILGGMAAVKQQRILSKGPEIVVATPGRLWELILEGNVHLSQVDNIRYLAIDETDRMVEKNHYKEFHHLLERINMDEQKRKRRQNFVFSATLTLVHDLPKHLHKKKHTKDRKSKKINTMTPEQKLKSIIDMLGISDPKVIDVTQERGTANSLTECRISCTLVEKDFYVYYFLQRHPGRTLMFCNSIGCVKRLATLLTLLKCDALPLHASMQQRQRLKNLERFRDNPLGVLVATDVAARGLDIPKVDHVLHYQTPRTSESYVHRSGRTARASEEGITVLLIEPNELNNYLKVCRTLGRTHDLPTFPVASNMLNAVKQRVKLARELDKLELLSKRTTSETGWLQKAAKDMDIIIEETNFQYGHVDKEDMAKTKLLINRRKKELASLLAKPIFPQGFNMKYPTALGTINIPLVQGDQSKEKAVDIMKTAIENCVMDKKARPRKLFTKKKVYQTNKNNSQSSFKTKNKTFKKKKH